MIVLTLRAFFAVFFPMLLVGFALGLWTARRPKRHRRVAPPEVTEPPINLRATLVGDKQLQPFIDACKRKEI